MYRLRLKTSLGGPIEHAIGDVYETADIGEARRLVLRGLASCDGPDDKAASKAKQELLAGLSEQEQLDLIHGKVIVTRRRGTPIPDDPCGRRTFEVRPLRPEDSVPRRRQTLAQKIKNRVTRFRQPRPYGPPKE
jgi:hypothetical protein